MQASWVLRADPRLSVSVNIDSDGVEATGQWTVRKGSPDLNYEG